jgi:hypothetical protein
VKITELLAKVVSKVSMVLIWPEPRHAVKLSEDLLLGTKLGERGSAGQPPTFLSTASCYAVQECDARKADGYAAAGTTLLSETLFEKVKS